VFGDAMLMVSISEMENRGCHVDDIDIRDGEWGLEDRDRTG